MPFSRVFAIVRPNKPEPGPKIGPQRRKGNVTMTSLNPLDLVPTELQVKYLPLAKTAFATATTAPKKLAEIQSDFVKDGGTERQWNALKHCAQYPR